MNMKVSGERTEQNNGGIAHCKYAIRGFKGHSPSDVSVAYALFFVLFLRWFFDRYEQTYIGNITKGRKGW